MTQTPTREPSSQFFCRMRKTLRSPVTLIVSVEALCVTLLVFANISERPNLSDIGRFVLLGVIATAYAEGGDRIERLRRYVANTTFINASSLWCLAAALVLPIGLAGAFTALLYAHTLVRAHRHQSARPFQMIYTGATEVAATMAASAIVGAFAADRAALGGNLILASAVVLAILAYALVNQGLVLTAVYLVDRPTRLRAVLPTAEDETMEFATLALAVLFAMAIIHAPFLSPVALVLIVVLRRSALVRELQVQATRDGKTGLLNSSGWRQEADRELVRAERLNGKISVLMVDLDHFKRLNDSYGHPAGDAALKAVADCLTDALRGYDAVGRFGGEEFIALLDADEKVSEAVANRLCDRIRALKLADGCVTASIGVGVGTAGALSLDELIAIADKALYVAKDCGRDQIHIIRAITRRAVLAPDAAVRT
jgi:diguanylate cyclase (GGDEF)-like protein